MCYCATEKTVQSQPHNTFFILEQFVVQLLIMQYVNSKYDDVLLLLPL
jgi:hypothetical protein